MTSVQPNELSDQDHPREELKTVQIDLTRPFILLVRRWKLIVSVAAVFFAASLLYALTARVYYKATASFMPPAQEFNPLSNMGGISPSLVLSGIGASSSSYYMSLLYSRFVEDFVVKQMHVDKEITDPEKARLLVQSKVSFDVQNSGIIVATGTDESPQKAADYTNAYLAGLYRLNQSMSFARFSQRRDFFNQQVAEARNTLEEAERQLVNAQETGGVLDPAGTTQVVISAQARLQAAIQAAEVNLATLRQSQTDAAPDVVRAKAELAQLRGQLSAAASSTAGKGARGLQAGGAVPSLSIETTRRIREVKEREAVYEALLRQADAIRVSSTDPGPQLQIIDRAVPPEKKGGPNRRKIVLLGTFVGLLLPSLYVLFFPPFQKFTRHFRQRLASDPV